MLFGALVARKTPSPHGKKESKRFWPRGINGLHGLRHFSPFFKLVATSAECHFGEGFLTRTSSFRNPDCFWRWSNMPVEKYQPIQDGLLLLRTAMFAEGTANTAASAKWATRAFTEAHRQSGADLLSSFGWLPIPHFVETAAYDQAIQYAHTLSKRNPPDETSLKTFELG